jgi:hypothetical protein
MSLQDDIVNVVYRDVMMPLNQGVEMLHLLGELRAAGQHPNLNEVLGQMQRELEASIEYVVEGHTGFNLKPGKTKY